MRKILLFTGSLGSGGAERQLVGLAFLLKNEGYDVRVLTYSKQFFYAPFLKENGIEHWYQPTLLPRKTRPWRLAKIIRKWKPNVTISYLQSCNMAACLAQLFSRTNLVVSERNTNQRASMKDKVLFNLYRMADKVIPNSYSQEKFIQCYFPFLNDKTTTITNFVDTDKFIPSVEGRVSEMQNIVTLARRMPQKNCIRFVEAVRMVKERGLKVHFDWYGDATTGADGIAYNKQFKEAIALQGVKDYITLHPATENAVEVYQQARAFCLPSLYEGFPNVVCEAMSCGKPVLCSNVCDNPSIVKDGISGLLFDPLKPEDIAEKIIDFLNRPVEQQQQMGVEGRRIAVDMFSKETFLSKYIQVIESL